MFNSNKKINLPRALGSRRNQEGVAIYLAVVVLMVVLTVAMGVSLLSIYQMKSLSEAGSSVAAFAAAESGIEWALDNVYDTNYSSACPVHVDLANGADYDVTASLCGASSEYLCVRSVGTYHGTQRAIRIMR